MIRSALTLALATIVVCIGILQLLRPFSAAPINPWALIVAGLLLFVRYGLVRQREKKLALMREVPKRPLGLSDER